jgi:hypothetical protein
MLAAPLILDGNQLRSFAQGDVLCLQDVAGATDTTNTNLTITAAMLLGRYITRNPAGVSNENLDTAANLIAGLTSNPLGVQNGLSWVVSWINLSANILTLVAAANTGLTLVRGSIPASVTKSVLVRIVNGSPALIASPVSTTNGAATLTGFTAAQLATITVGMIVTNAVAGLQGTTVIGVNQASGVVTMSGNANATSVVSVNFSPQITFTGLAV